MGDKINLVLAAREERGKKATKLRREGVVPGVIYGQGLEPTLVQAPYNVVEKVVRAAGRHTPVYVELSGKKKIAMIKDVDRDPVKARIRHVSFHAVKAGETVVAEVPIRLEGEGDSPAERAGLVVLQAIENIEVRAKPADLPEALVISTDTLATDEDKLTLSDIKLPSGVQFADLELDLELVVANVYEPAALQAANDAAGGDAEEADADTVESDNGGEEAAATESKSEEKSE